MVDELGCATFHLTVSKFTKKTSFFERTHIVLEGTAQATLNPIVILFPAFPAKSLRCVLHPAKSPTEPCECIRASPRLVLFGAQKPGGVREGAGIPDAWALESAAGTSDFAMARRCKLGVLLALLATQLGFLGQPLGLQTGWKWAVAADRGLREFTEGWKWAVARPGGVRVHRGVGV